MPFKPCIFLIISWFIFSACNEEDHESKVGEGELLTGLSVVGEFKLDFPIDKAPFLDLYSILMTEINEEGYIAFPFQGIDGFNIVIYDLGSGEQVKDIKIEYEGPDGIGNELTKMVLHSLDTLVIFNQWTRSFTIHNDQGKILSKIELPPHESGNNRNPTPTVMHGQEYFSFGDKIYIPCFLPPKGISSQSEKLIILDLSNNSLEMVGERPEIYNNFLLGGFAINNLSMAYNSYNESFMLNFPALEELWEWSIENRSITRKFPAQSAFIKEFKPLARIGEKVSPENRKIHENTQSYYNKVFFDPSNGYTYRMATILYPSNAHEKVIKHNYSIIILDSLGEFVEEVLLDQDKYIPYYSFNGPKGIYILNKEKFEENEDQIVFDILSYR